MSRRSYSSIGVMKSLWVRGRGDGARAIMAEPTGSKQADSAPPLPAAKSGSWIKWLALSAVALALAIVASLWLGKSFQEFLKKHWEEVLHWKEENPWLL